MNEAVNHPPHYGGADDPYEAIKVIEAWGLGFCLGNAVKCISRAGRKDASKVVEDLEKARWYLDREIARRRLEAATTELSEASPADTGRASAEAAWDEGFEAGSEFAGRYTNGNNGAPDPPPNPYADEPVMPPKPTRSFVCPFAGCPKHDPSAAMSRRAVLDHMAFDHEVSGILPEPKDIQP